MKKVFSPFQSGRYSASSIAGEPISLEKTVSISIPEEGVALLQRQDMAALLPGVSAAPRRPAAIAVE